MNRQQRRSLKRKARKPDAAGGDGGVSGQAFATAVDHHRAGRLDEAQAGYRRALASRPRYAPALHNLGLIAHQTGDQVMAIDLVAKAITIDGTIAAFHNTLGNARKASGDLDGAVASFRHALSIQPDFAEAHFNLGDALHERGEIDAAVESYRRALDIAPKFAEALNNLGHALQDTDDLDGAVDCYRKALALRPAEAQWQCNLGHALHAQGRFDDAIASLTNAIDLDPMLAEAHNNLGNVHKDAGRLDEARAAYRQAIGIRPAYAEAHYNLVGLTRLEADDPVIGRLAALRDAAALPLDEAINLRFALGKIYADTGDHDAAFDAYRQGNELRDRAAANRGRRFDTGRHSDRIARIIDVFSKEFFAEREDFGLGSELPVLIVGMPRSGTTLIEQILASHGAVAGGGELPHLGRIATSGGESFPEFMPDLDRAGAQRLAAAYLDRLREISSTASRVTDKMPDNFLLLGMTAVLLPGARVIHCRRDPLDTCLSCYFQHFTHGHEFTNDLARLGAYFREYRRLMDHWRKVLPHPPLDVSYEELIANQEEISRRIVDFCGLDWDDACLRFHENARPVRTASNVQVRRKLFATSVERWRAYDRHLQPLRDALEETS